MLEGAKPILNPADMAPRILVRHEVTLIASLLASQEIKATLRRH